MSIKYMRHKRMGNTTHLSLQPSLLVVHEYLVLKSQEGIKAMLAWNSNTHLEVFLVHYAKRSIKASGI